MFLCFFFSRYAVILKVIELIFEGRIFPFRNVDEADILTSDDTFQALLTHFEHPRYEGEAPCARAVVGSAVGLRTWRPFGGGEHRPLAARVGRNRANNKRLSAGSTFDESGHVASRLVLRALSCTSWLSL